MQRRSLLASLVAAPLVAGTASAATNFIAAKGGERLFYKDVGSGRPVVFIHGWTLSSAIWRDHLDALTAKGFRAIAYDRRGHGQSTKPESGYDYDTLADDLAALLDRLDLTDVVLVGHSMGSGEVVRYFVRHGAARIAKVILLAPTTPFNLKTPDNPDGIDRKFYDQIVAALQADRRSYLLSGLPGFLGPNAAPELVDWAMSIALQAAPQAQIGCMRALSETDFRPEMSLVTRPTLVLYGTGDAPSIAVSSRRTHEAIAGSRLEIYEGAPHALFLTDAERFKSDLVQFARI